MPRYCPDTGVGMPRFGIPFLDSIGILIGLESAIDDYVSRNKGRKQMIKAFLIMVAVILFSGCASVFNPNGAELRPWKGMGSPCFQIMPQNLGDPDSATGSSSWDRAGDEHFARNASKAGIQKCLEWRAAHPLDGFTQKELDARMKAYEALPGW